MSEGTKWREVDMGPDVQGHVAPATDGMDVAVRVGKDREVQVKDTTGMVGVDTPEGFMVVAAGSMQDHHVALMHFARTVHQITLDSVQPAELQNLHLAILARGVAGMIMDGKPPEPGCTDCGGCAI